MAMPILWRCLLCVACSSLAIALQMFAAVDVLTEDEGDSVVGPPPPVAHVRKGKKRKIALKSEAPKPVDVLKRLKQDCSCNAKACLRQFSSNDKLEEYKEYLEQWNDLMKLDQDQIVFCRNWLGVKGDG